MSEQKQPQTRPPMAEDTEPVDTAKALELIEAGPAASICGARARHGPHQTAQKAPPG